MEAAFATAGMSVRIAGREKTLYSIYRKMDEKHLSFAQVTDIYGFRIIVPTRDRLLHRRWACCTRCTSRVPGKFKDHIAIAKVNGYQSLHTTLVGPSGVNIEFQMRTEAMHVVAESGVAAHWLYKAQRPGRATGERLGTKWLQSLLDIQHETRDAAEFWDHVKVDLFPDAVYVFTPQEPDPGAAAWRDGGRLRLRDPQQCRRPHRRRPHQWRTGAAAHRAEER